MPRRSANHMQEYRCYFLGNDGRIAARREYAAVDDSEASEFAEHLYAVYVESTGTDYGFELWQRVRRVCTVPASAPRLAETTA
jgi:hypothetical protein